jgi:hypothetical protein
MNETLKQIACVGAYAAGVAVGMYGAYKVVNAIEKKFPMKNNPFESRITTRRFARIKIEAVEGTDLKNLSVAYLDGKGEVLKFVGTSAEITAKLKELEFEPIKTNDALSRQLAAA